MKILFSALTLGVLAAPALAHSGHTALVDGHAHSLADLALMGAGLAFLAIGGIGAILYLVKRAKRRND